MQGDGFPIRGVRGVRGPDTYGFVLRGGGNVGFAEDSGGPGDVAHPVGVAGEGEGGEVGFGFGAVGGRDA